MVPVVEWWPMRRYINGKSPPTHLGCVFEALPGEYGTVMNLGIFKLTGCSWKCTFGLLTEITFSFLMVESDATNRSPTIAEFYIWIV